MMPSNLWTSYLYEEIPKSRRRFLQAVRSKFSLDQQQPFIGQKVLEVELTFPLILVFGHRSLLEDSSLPSFLLSRVTLSVLLTLAFAARSLFRTFLSSPPKLLTLYPSSSYFTTCIFWRSLSGLSTRMNPFYPPLRRALILALTRLLSSYNAHSSPLFFPH